jgi:hypothetical protein
MWQTPWVAITLIIEEAISFAALEATSLEFIAFMISTDFTLQLLWI